MTNFEYWKDEIEKLGFDFRVVNGKLEKCVVPVCNYCKFSSENNRNDEIVVCGARRIRWLYSEHAEAPKLTANERKLCEILNSSYMARDLDGALYCYKKMPKKTNNKWMNMHLNEGDFFIDDRLFKDCNFPFIKWEDPKPWSVEELLKLEVE